jgi:CheY-like chemotaxis protein
MNGLDAMKYIKQLKPSIPIVAQTAYAFENEKTDFIKQGFDGYLVKPFKISELMSFLNSKLLGS